MAVIGPDGEFGIDAYRWTPLYAGTDGWMESLALTDRAGRWARTVTRIKGKDVESLDLHGYEPVLEVQGRTTSSVRSRPCCTVSNRKSGVVPGSSGRPPEWPVRSVPVERRWRRSCVRRSAAPTTTPRPLGKDTELAEALWRVTGKADEAVAVLNSVFARAEQSP
ncbi:hypothetical protein [Streptomyces sp. NPDC058145]|uniref:hypothetical protein n=1 Tax=Streptomyces sp. NPDC058145 TaxID=3346356 RepID=UPI0036EDD468